MSLAVSRWWVAGGVSRSRAIRSFSTQGLASCCPTQWRGRFRGARTELGQPGTVQNGVWADEEVQIYKKFWKRLSYSPCIIKLFLIIFLMQQIRTRCKPSFHKLGRYVKHFLCGAPCTDLLHTPLLYSREATATRPRTRLLPYYCIARPTVSCAFLM